MAQEGLFAGRTSNIGHVYPETMGERPNVAEKVRTYITGHPSVADGLRLGIVNQSALARYISEELDIPNTGAITAACKRSPQRKGGGHREAAVRGVLRRSRIETRTRVATLTLGRSPQALVRLSRVAKELLEEGRLFRLIQGSQGTVVIVDDDAVERVARELSKEQLVKTRRGLVEVGVVSPESIEEVPGIMARLSSALAAADLNVLQAMSCYTDSLFIVEERDMVKAFEALRTTLS